MVERVVAAELEPDPPEEDPPGAGVDAEPPAAGVELEPAGGAAAEVLSTGGEETEAEPLGQVPPARMVNVPDSTVVPALSRRRMKTCVLAASVTNQE